MSKILCENCNQKFSLTSKTNQVSFCPFCGEELCVIDRGPLLNTFEELDEFDEVEYFYEDDE